MVWFLIRFLGGFLGQCSVRRHHRPPQPAGSGGGAPWRESALGCAGAAQVSSRTPALSHARLARSRFSRATVRIVRGSAWGTRVGVRTFGESTGDQQDPWGPAEGSRASECKVFGSFERFCRSVVHLVSAVNLPCYTLLVCSASVCIDCGSSAILLQILSW